MLEIENLSKRFGAQTVLSNINLSVRKGATLALIGSSGSGKTTLLRIILGLLPSDSGTVTIGGQALDALSPGERSERIGYVPQEAGLFPHLSGADNVALVAELRGWSRDRIRARTEELRGLVDLAPDLLRRFPHEMSGGQRQRIAIMRAAMLDPAVLLLDEPMGALDPVIRRNLQAELKAICERLGKTVVLVTHDLGEAVFLAPEIALLHQGALVQVGTFADLALRPANSYVETFVGAQRTLPERETLR